MKNILKNINSEHLKIIKNIGEQAQKANNSAYLVGGAVRDILLGQRNIDLDILIEHDAIKFAQKLGLQWKTKIVKHKSFMTATLKMDGPLIVDFATIRKEVYPSPGALPNVQKGVLKDDLFRRDFTINTMAICINKNCFGELVDMFNGLNDLNEKKIRILHQESFIDDPTRILRAVRFEQRLAFQIDRYTLKCLKDAAKKNVFLSVSPSRYIKELDKIFKEQNSLEIFKRLKALNCLTCLDERFNGSLYAFKLIRKRWAIYERNLSESLSFYCWLSLLEKQNQKVQDNIIKRFHLKNDIQKTLLQMREQAAIMVCLNRKSLSRAQIYNYLNKKSKLFVEYLLLRSSGRAVKNIILFLTELNKASINLSGTDLRGMGIDSGKKIGKILEIIKVMKIEGKLKNRTDEINEVRRILKN